MKTFNKVSCIFALFISLFVLFISFPLWMSKQPIIFKFKVDGDLSDISINYGGKTAKILSHNDLYYYFKVDNYLSSNSFKIYIKNAKSKIEISDISVNNQKIYIENNSNLIVSGGKAKFNNDNFTVYPILSDVIISSPIKFETKVLFKPIMFLIIFSVIFFSSYLLFSRFELNLYLIVKNLKSNKISDNFNKILFSIFLFIMIFLFGIFLLSVLGFLIKLSIQKFYIFVSFIIAVLSLIFLDKKYNFSKKDIIIQSCFIFLCLFISSLLSLTFWDYSWDGRNYHQEAIILLSNGWNPIFEKLQFSLFNPTLWIEHYPKLAEILSANFVLLFDNIEIGKIINYLISFSTFCLTFYTFNNFKNSNVLYNFLLSILVLLNPVSICQVGSFCVDIFVYYFFVNILCLIILKEKLKISNGLFIFFTVINLVMLSNVKFGGLFYSIAIIIIYFCYLVFNKYFDALKPLSITIILSAVLILLSGINPYFTNIKQGYNAFYPILGEEKIDIIIFHAPKNFENKNQIEKLFISLFSNTEHTYFFVEKNTNLKIPFSIKNQAVFSVADMRISGFGYLFGGIIILIIFFTFFTKFPKTQDNKILYFIMNLVFLTVFLNPVAWWARYVPQLWLIPIFIIFWKNLTEDKSFSMKLFINVLILLIFLNSLIIEFQNIKTRADFTSSRKEFLAQVKDKNIKVFENGEIISEQNIYYRFSKQNTVYDKVSKEYYLKNIAMFDNLPNYLEENLKWSVFYD